MRESTWVSWMDQQQINEEEWVCDKQLHGSCWGISGTCCIRVCFLLQIQKHTCLVSLAYASR